MIEFIKVIYLYSNIYNNDNDNNGNILHTPSLVTLDLQKKYEMFLYYYMHSDAFDRLNYSITQLGVYMSPIHSYINIINVFMFDVKYVFLLYSNIRPIVNSVFVLLFELCFSIDFQQVNRI